MHRRPEREGNAPKPQAGQVHIRCVVVRVLPAVRIQSCRAWRYRGESPDVLPQQPDLLRLRVSESVGEETVRQELGLPPLRRTP